MMRLADSLGPANDLGIPNLSFQSLVHNGFSILFLVTGALSVIFVIVGGLMFVVSGGDPGRVKSARETIIYALIGVVISLVAFAVVSFILGNFGS